MLARLVLAALACLLVVPGSARADWPSLAGTTTIEGTRSGYAVLRLAQPLEIELDRGIPLELSGAGRFYGVALRQDGMKGDKGFNAQTLRGDGMDSFDGPQRLYPWISEDDVEHGDSVTMPAGLYRLYVIADGKPVRATLTLPGLGGAATVEPAATVPQKVLELPRREDAGPSSLSSFEGAGELRSEGLWSLRIDLDEKSSTRTDIETCHFGPDDAGSMDPGCGNLPGLLDRVSWTVEGTVFSLAFFPLYAPDWAQYAAGSLAAGEAPYIPVSPFQAPWSGRWSFVWDTNRFAEPGTWRLGGNVQIYGDPSSSAAMTGLWMDWEGTTPVMPADPVAPVSVPPAPAPTPSPGTSPAVAAPSRAAAPRRTTSVRKKAAKPCRARKARGKKRAKRCTKKRAAPKRKRARTRRH